MAINIESTCARDTCIGNTCIMGIWIRCSDIRDAYTKVIYTKSAFVGSIEPRVLAELGITWVGLEVNNCCL